eukprot:12723_1
MNVAALNFSNLMQMFSDRFEITKGDKYETQFIPNMKRLIDRMNKETHNASIVSIFMDREHCWEEWFFIIGVLHSKRLCCIALWFQQYKFLL